MEEPKTQKKPAWREHHIKWCCFVLVLVLTLWQSQAHAIRMIDQVKGVFLYNFIHFVQWEKQPDTVKICLKTPQEFAQVMQQIAKEKNKSGANEFELRFIKSAQEDFSSCDLFYLSKENVESGFGKDMASSEERGHTLLITDDETLFNKTGDVYLYEQDSRIRLKVNYRRIQKRKMRLSAKLLRLAEEVR